MFQENKARDGGGQTRGGEAGQVQCQAKSAVKKQKEGRGREELERSAPTHPGPGTLTWKQLAICSISTLPAPPLRQARSLHAHPQLHQYHPGVLQGPCCGNAAWSRPGRGKEWETARTWTAPSSARVLRNPTGTEVLPSPSLTSLLQTHLQLWDSRSWWSTERNEALGADPESASPKSPSAALWTSRASPLLFVPWLTHFRRQRCPRAAAKPRSSWCNPC